MLALSKIKTWLLNFICPPHCPICQCEVDEAHCLCSTCFSKLNFITRPCCEICGRPFEYRPFGKSICGPCMTKKPYFAMARSILRYDKFSKQLVLAFKHADHTEIACLFSKFLLQVDPDIFNVDAIMAVPLHPSRLLYRKYNQAALLVQEISKKKHITIYSGILKRIKATPSQGHLSKNQRKANISKAFGIVHPEEIKDKTILLVDDVMTTGATINECSKVLKKAGAKQVNVLTVYRVIYH